MNSIILQNKEQLENLAYETSLLYAAEQPGEDFHPLYKKNRKLFVKIVKAQIRIERYIKRYFKELSTRIYQKIDWQDYYNKVYKGSVFQKDVDFEDEVIQLQLAFQDELDDIFGFGIQGAIDDLGIQTDITQDDASSIKALKDYTLKLAKDITDTTKERVKQSILRSIVLGESQEEATERLLSIIDNPKRAAMIAHTETVRAYSMGKLATGERLGAQYKVWRDGQPGACPICTKLHGVAVPLNMQFPTITGGLVNESPAHPWCKCLTKIVLDKSFLRDDETILTANDIEEAYKFAKGKKKSAKGGVWVTIHGHPVLLKSKGAKKKGTHGFSFATREVPGLSFKRAKDLISHEGSPDRARVIAYKKLITSGRKVTPVLVVKEGSKWGIADGKHRFQAFKELRHKFIPTTTIHSKQYDQGTEADHQAMQ